MNYTMKISEATVQVASLTAPSGAMTEFRPVVESWVKDMTHNTGIITDNGIIYSEDKKYSGAIKTTNLGDILVLYKTERVAQITLPK